MSVTPVLSPGPDFEAVLGLPDALEVGNDFDVLGGSPKLGLAVSRRTTRG